MKTLQFLQKNLVYMIPIAMVMGIFLGEFIDKNCLSPFILPLTFLMIYPQMVNLNIKQLSVRPQLKLKIISLIINFVLLPALAFFLGQIFFSQSPLDAMGLLLIALLPTGSMTIAYTGMTKGNLPAAIRISVFSLLLGAFLAPLYLYYFMGEVIDIDFIIITKKILLVIFLPLIFGFFTRYILVKKFGEKSFKSKFGKKIGVFSVLGVLGMVFSVMAMKSDFILANPEKTLYYLFPLGTFYLVAFAVSTILGKYFFNKKDALALVFSTSLRHLAIALAVAVTSFGEKGLEIALIISIAFVFQVKMGAWYAKLSDKIFPRKNPV